MSRRMRAERGMPPWSNHTWQRWPRDIGALVVTLSIIGAAGDVGATNWTVGQSASSHPGQSQATTINAPTNGATSSPTATSLVISWTAPSAGAPPSGYTVTRNGAAVPSGSGCFGTIAATSCTDTGLTTNSTYTYTVTAVLGSYWTSPASSSFQGTAAGDSFSIANPGTETAGASFNVTITAKLAGGTTDTSYSGTKSIVFSGPSNSPNATAPTYPSTVSFTSGVGVASIILPDAQSTTLTATQSAVTGSTTSFSVNAANIALSFSPSSYSLQLQGDQYSYDVVRASTDSYGNADPNATSSLTVNLTDNSPGHGATWSQASVTIASNASKSGPVQYLNPTHNQSVTLTGTPTTSGYANATVTYSVTNTGSNPSLSYATEASALDTGAGHSTVSSSYTSTSGATELVFVYRISNSASSDAITSVTGPFTGASAVGPVENFTSYGYLWTYAVTGNGASGSVTINFSPSASNTSTFVYVLQLSGNNTNGVAARVRDQFRYHQPGDEFLVQQQRGPNGELVVAAVLDSANQSVTVNTPSSGSWSPTTYSGNNGTVGYGMGLFETSAAQASISATLSRNDPWGVVTLELNHG